jgi:hypothetical protein
LDAMRRINLLKKRILKEEGKYECHHNTGNNERYPK